MIGMLSESFINKRFTCKKILRVLLLASMSATFLYLALSDRYDIMSLFEHIKL